ncbi:MULTISPECIES: GNAT family N-acetyltransferase [unclassified Pseudovibrio]|uniref:GNAT family N-acetyltransferase n=1 Tax=unclassified Pseudovibrio TaxID=2627060 RepID=UPI0007AE9F95|nr:MULTISPECIES: GNAT family N-acetyltransferase [unclassified Pseudovibrio]KZL02723.1 Acetyltransferase (GNAT) family protein [Pseudovibrio sp. W74]KZL12392.1 Acetyltransferase (GNAT) family protein [Pseudovibrio sp. Ad14]
MDTSSAKPTQFFIRKTQRNDVDELLALLNRIIEAGGTTALEKPLNKGEFIEWFLEAKILESSVCAIDRDSGEPLGFQTASHYGDIPADWVDIGTFVKPGLHKSGIGSALFKATLANLEGKGLVAITATIRADNTGGLAYYTSRGFKDYKVLEAVPLADGTPVNRICKRFDLG